MNRTTVINNLSPPIDDILCDLLLKEFNSVEKRYSLCDWEPATLDGGQFAELASRIIYHIDSSNLNKRKSVNDCLNYIEDSNNRNAHHLPSRRTALHLCKVLRTIYKFRSQRGAIHIDPEYTANELDATMLLANVRWIMSELIRLFWSGSNVDASKIIKEIIKYDVPVMMKYDDKFLVLRIDCTIEEEILILLYNAGEEGISRETIGLSILRSKKGISNSLTKLKSTKLRQIILNNAGKYVITILGIKRIKDELSDKIVFE